MGAVDGPGDKSGATPLRPGRTLAWSLAVVKAGHRPVPGTVRVTLQSRHLGNLSVGSAAVVGGVTFAAMAGGVAARFFAGSPQSVAIAPGE